MAIPNDSFEKALRLRSQALNRIHKLPRSIPPAGTAAKPVVTGGIFTPGQQRQSPADYYAGVIKRDPMYMQGMANSRAQGIENTTGGADIFRRLLVQYGLVPEGFEDPHGWVNEETRQLAAQNTAAGLSDSARLRRGYEMATKRGSRELAARGMLQSGALTQQRGELDLGYRQQQAEAVNRMLEAAAQARAQYAQAERDRIMQEQGLASDAAGRAALVAQPAAPVEQPWQRALRLRSEGMNKNPRYYQTVRNAR